MNILFNDKCKLDRVNKMFEVARWAGQTGWVTGFMLKHVTFSPCGNRLGLDPIGANTSCSYSKLLLIINVLITITKTILLQQQYKS